MNGSGGQTAAIKEFIQELNGFAATAEATLKKIEEDMVNNKKLFSVFSERMLTIRGTAEQLNLPHIAQFAELGEEIAAKAVNAETRHQIRKCVGSLWDALTTVKYLLENHELQETVEEQQILRTRLEATLKALGGQRPKASEDEIEALLNAKN